MKPLLDSENLLLTQIAKGLSSKRFSSCTKQHQNKRSQMIVTWVMWYSVAVYCLHLCPKSAEESFTLLEPGCAETCQKRLCSSSSQTSPNHLLQKSINWRMYKQIVILPYNEILLSNEKMDYLHNMITLVFCLFIFFFGGGTRESNPNTSHKLISKYSTTELHHLPLH